MNLRHRLKNGDDDAHKHTEQQNRGAKAQRDAQAVAENYRYVRRVHPNRLPSRLIFSAPRYGFRCPRDSRRAFAVSSVRKFAPRFRGSRRRVTASAVRNARAAA
jgi:hypothetical protein